MKKILLAALVLITLFSCQKSKDVQAKQQKISYEFTADAEDVNGVINSATPVHLVK